MAAWYGLDAQAAGGPTDPPSVAPSHATLPHEPFAAAQFVRMVLDAIDRPAVGPTTVIGDNSAMHELVTKEGSSSRSRHFERTTIFIKYAVMRLIVVCLLIGTKFMSADILTKATDETTFKTMRGVIRNQVEEGLAMRAMSWVATLMRTRRCYT